jgi:hypothetical protein|tara:strand:- start:1438 stop:1728 length:291 start_codon:yes stop_codon:yes gene_type:complete
MRYQFTPIQKRWDGNRVYATTYYPVIPPDANDIYITASEEDYLDSLAKKYYGNEGYWWVIANANNLGNGRLSIPLGKQIRIPGNLPQIMQDLKEAN